MEAIFSNGILYYYAVKYKCQLWRLRDFIALNWEKFRVTCNMKLFKTLLKNVAKLQLSFKKICYSQGEYTGGQSLYFFPYKDEIFFIWLVIAWYALLWLAVTD